MYEKERLYQQDKGSLTKLQLELDQIYADKARGAFVRWLEEREKDTTYFFIWKKRNAELSSLSLILTASFRKCKCFVYNLLWKIIYQKEWY